MFRDIQITPHCFRIRFVDLLMRGTLLITRDQSRDRVPVSVIMVPFFLKYHCCFTGVFSVEPDREEIEPAVKNILLNFEEKLVNSIWLTLLFVVSIGVITQRTTPADVEKLPVIKELPDPFLKPEGTRLKTKQEWKQQRRWLLEQLLDFEYGNLPPAPHNVTGTEIASKPLEGLQALEKEILLSMGPKKAVQTHLILTLPSGKGPFPMIVRGDLGWGRVAPEIVEAVVKRGYGLAEFNRVEIAPDSAERGGVYAAYPEYDGGRLAAWAWGYHRVIDFLVTQPFVDRKHIAITGHSRGGKATLLAGATDDRIALTAPNNSGCGGAGCYRLQGENSEDIAAILKNFPFWFHPGFSAFIGKVDRLPFDQHTLKALVAPRALLSTEGLGDLWANPSGTQQSYLAAKEVFDFLGAGDKIGIVFRPGKHEQNLEDWTALLDFSDRQFFDRPIVRRFDQRAFPDAPSAYSWKSPSTSPK
jgi:hypothetical protein